MRDLSKGGFLPVNIDLAAIRLPPAHPHFTAGAGYVVPGRLVQDLGWDSRSLPDVCNSIEDNRSKMCIAFILPYMRNESRLHPVRCLTEHAVLRGGRCVHDGALRHQDRGAPSEARPPVLLRSDGESAVRYGRHDHWPQSDAGAAV